MFKLSFALVLALVAVQTNGVSINPIKIQLTNDGFAYGEAAIGTPAQKFGFLINSGSPVSWVMTKDYTGDCSRSIHGYDGSSSSSYQKDGREYASNIQGQRYSGFLSVDKFTVGGVEVEEQTFSEIDNFPGTLMCWRKFTGGLGLGLSDGNGSKSLVDDLVEKKLIPAPVVAIDFNRNAPKGVDGAAGEVILGGIDSKKHRGEINYVPSASKTQWEVDVASVSVEGKSGIKVCENGCTASVVSQNYWNFGPIEEIRKINAAIGAEESVWDGKSTWVLPCERDGKPDIVFNIGGKEYRLQPEDYILGTPGTTKNPCHSAFGNRKVAGDGWILGANFIEKFYTVFNYETKQIGFASKN